MRKNVGGSERIVRLLLGGALLSLALSRWRGRARGKAAMATALELLASAVAQWCPANAAIGRNSYRPREPAAEAMGDMPA